MLLKLVSHRDSLKYSPAKLIRDEISYVFKDGDIATLLLTF